MSGAKRAALAIGLAALCACTAPKLPEGEYRGLVAKRAAVEVRPGGAEGASRPAYAWTVKLDGGRWITVVQGEPMFAIGERVKVVTGDGPARIERP
jgi:hypothetical protein